MDDTVKVTAVHSHKKDFEQFSIIQDELSVMPSIHVGCAVQSKEILSFVNCKVYQWHVVMV
jgi:hypothetical protein